MPERYQTDRTSPWGDVLGRLEFGLLARDEEHALQAGYALLDHRVLRIDGADAVDDEGVAVEVGRERADGERPDALVVLRHLPAPPEVAADGDLVGLRGIDAERDLLVGRDLGRLERVVGCGLTAGLLRRGHRRPAEPSPRTAIETSRRDASMMSTSGRVIGTYACYKLTCVERAPSGPKKGCPIATQNRQPPAQVFSRESSYFTPCGVIKAGNFARSACHFLTSSGLFVAVYSSIRRFEVSGQLGLPGLREPVFQGEAQFDGGCTRFGSGGQACDSSGAIRLCHRSRVTGFAFGFFDHCSQPGHDAACGDVDCPHGDAARLRRRRGALPLDRGEQECLPGRLAEFLANLISRPQENPAAVFDIKQGGLSTVRRGDRFEHLADVRVAAALGANATGGEQVDHEVAGDSEQPASERAACGIRVVSVDGPRHRPKDLLARSAESAACQPLVCARLLMSGV